MKDVINERSLINIFILALVENYLKQSKSLGFLNNSGLYLCMISARPLELKIQQKKNITKNNWSNFSVAYLEISHRKESENHVMSCLHQIESWMLAKRLKVG